MGSDMYSEFEIAVEWFDDDVVEFRCRGSNGTFAGAVRAYAGRDAASELARTIAGFPANATDRRDFEFGTFDPKLAGGGARLQFLCVDQVGHAVVHLELRADPQLRGGESAIFSIPVEAGAIDSFVSDLKRMPLSVGAMAKLMGAA